MAAVPDCAVEQELLRGGGRLAALDEVGRGALAGPVTVGAVVIRGRFAEVPQGLRDSKLLSAAARERLVAPVQDWVEEWSIGHADPGEIDRIGIIGALRLAAHRALSALRGPVRVVLLDGTIDYVSPGLFGKDPAGDVITGSVDAAVVTRAHADRDCASVAAASVLAKVTRDGIMTALAEHFPAYSWARNKGYGTAEHAAAIAAHGTCEHHRRSWRIPGSAM